MAAKMPPPGQIDRHHFGTRQGHGQFALEAFAQQSVTQIGAEFDIEQRDFHRLRSVPRVNSRGSQRSSGDFGLAMAPCCAIALPGGKQG